MSMIRRRGQCKLTFGFEMIQEDARCLILIRASRIMRWQFQLLFRFLAESYSSTLKPRT